MAVKHFYNCPTHGIFEAWEAKCPKGNCSGVTISFQRGLAIKSSRTKSIDKTKQGLAQDFKMSNMKDTREGESQSGYFVRNNQQAPREARPADSVIWGGAGNMNMGAALNGSIGAPSVRGEGRGILPSQAGIKQGPKTASYIPDHENLKIT